MKIIKCPVNGPRPAQEFHFGGELRAMPDPANVTDEQWADYIYNRCGEPGVKREWWYHIPSGTWFVAERHNCSDEFQRTYLYGKEQDDTAHGNESQGNESQGNESQGNESQGDKTKSDEAQADG